MTAVIQLKANQATYSELLDREVLCQTLAYDIQRNEHSLSVEDVSALFLFGNLSSSSGSFSPVDIRLKSNTGEIYFDWINKTSALRVIGPHKLATHLGEWKGDDLKSMLKTVIKTRSQL